MGWTSENVAGEFNISRGDMDDFAAKSFQRAEAADRAGYFAKEIVPFTSYQKDPATGARKKVTVSKDDGIRYGTTKATLSKIKSAFPQWPPSQTTGGNASQITDGAAAVLLMTRQRAENLGLRILSKYVNTAVTGELSPCLMACQSRHAPRPGPPRHGHWTNFCHSESLSKSWPHKGRCRSLRGTRDKKK